MKIVKRISISLLLITIITIGINHVFYKPTEFNSIIASKIYKEPANSSFEDDNFYQCVVDAYNKKNNTTHPYTYNLSDEELKTITYLSCSNKGITNAKGLEKFTALTNLYVNNNQLTEIDVSQNTALTNLYVNNNQLTEIDVSQNTALTNLYVNNNQLTEIDVSKNTSLTSLSVASNQLTQLDVSNNTSLIYLDVYFNKLTKIDVSKNTVLRSLDIAQNELTELDISANTALIDVVAYANKLTSLDVSKNISLTSLTVSHNQLTELDVSNNSLLEELNLKNNDIKKLYLSDNVNSSKLSEILSSKTMLQYLSIGDKIININTEYTYYFNDHIQIKDNNTTISSFINNLGLVNLKAKIYNEDTEITDGTISYGNTLKIYDEEDNFIDELTITIFNDASGFSSERLYQCVVDAYNKKNNTTHPYTYNLSDTELKTITYLYCNSKGIKNATGIEKLTSLIQLDLTFNKLQEIDVSQNTALEYLYVWDNELKEIDISKNLALETLAVGGNNLTNIDVSYNPELKYFDVANTQLTELDVSNNLELEELYVDNNQLTKIDVSNNLELEVLYVDNNQLTKIDVSNNLELEELYVDNNQLTKIDVSQNTALEYFYAYNNQLTELDVSHNLSLGVLDIENNQLTKLDTSNNTELTSLYISGNPFSEEVYLYKVKNTTIGNNIKIASQLNWNSPTWTSKDENIATVDGNGNITGLKPGTVDIKGMVSNKYTTTSTVHVVEITSDKYVINEEDNNVYIGTEKNLAKVKNYINISHKNVTLEINNNKLQVKHNDTVLKEFEFITIDFGKFKSGDKSVSVTKDITYEEFISNITKSNGITYKIFKDNEEIISGTIEKDMVLKVYYNNKEIDTFSITNEYLIIDESINVNNDNMNLSNINFNTSVKDILSKIDTTGEITVKNKNNILITDDDLIGTGSVITIKLSQETYEYKAIIYGDIDGDGHIKLPDIMKIANYVYKDKGSLSGVYLEAADYDRNKVYGLSDIMGAARTLYD